MDWSNCFTTQRLGDTPDTQGYRTQYQRDFDRLIFSSAFRRLQSKTQVFPLPGSTFVHNRLTHSLEVASVGRSLGFMVGECLTRKYTFSSDVRQFFDADLSAIIAAGCLAHDIGNPAFGHSGENAISHYFKNNKNVTIEGNTLCQFYTDREWSDLTNFEGNANALRILTQHFPGKSAGGLGLTITTLASILKYPCGSHQLNKSLKHRKKYNYFYSEACIFKEIVDTLAMIKDNDGAYCRHPFVYLVEAADDICYRIIDIEDAHRLKIIRRNDLASLLLNLLQQLDTTVKDLDKTAKKFHSLYDDNAAISYLRAKCINALTSKCVEIFLQHESSILQGQYNSTLVNDIEAKSLDDIEAFSISHIYNSPSVVEVEVTGYRVMSELLGMFIPAVLTSSPNSFFRKVLKLLPYAIDKDMNPYQKTMTVLDHVSAMTDEYATDLYRKITGIEISRHV